MPRRRSHRTPPAGSGALTLVRAATVPADRKAAGPAYGSRWITWRAGSGSVSPSTLGSPVACRLLLAADRTRKTRRADCGTRSFAKRGPDRTGPRGTRILLGGRGGTSSFCAGAPGTDAEFETSQGRSDRRVRSDATGPAMPAPRPPRHTIFDRRLLVSPHGVHPAVIQSDADRADLQNVLQVIVTRDGRWLSTNDAARLKTSRCPGSGFRTASGFDQPAKATDRLSLGRTSG